MAVCKAVANLFVVSESVARRSFLHTLETHSWEFWSTDYISRYPSEAHAAALQILHSIILPAISETRQAHSNKVSNYAGSVTFDFLAHPTDTYMISHFFGLRL